MTGRRRYAGRARAALAVALALALFGPGPLVSPSPGGDEGSRSTPNQPPDLLMVNVNETTCLALSPDGSVFAGTDGGGIAHWTEGGVLASVHTTADGGLPSNHIVDLATHWGSSFAVTASPEPRLIVTGSGGDGWAPTDDIPGAKAQAPASGGDSPAPAQPAGADAAASGVDGDPSQAVVSSPTSARTRTSPPASP